MWVNRALTEHMQECAAARLSLEARMDAGFGEARRKIDERHAENQIDVAEAKAAIKVLAEEGRAAHDALHKTLVKALWAVIMLFVASYLAAHGFTVPAGH